MVASIKHLTYPERLEALKLHSLLHRRRRGDLITVWKILHNKVDGDFPWLIRDHQTTVRNNGFKLYKKARPSRHHHVFSYRVIEDWNGLPSEIVSVETMDAFKSGLDRCLVRECYDVA